MMTQQQQDQSKSKFFHKAKPFFAVIFLQFGLAGMDILSKAALNEGMSNYVFVVYRHAIATIAFAPFAFFLEKKTRPKMTVSIFIKLMLLSILEPVIDQNLYILGMKNTTATFAAAMCNVLPAITFVMACIFKLENIRINSTHSQAKVIGTITTVAGAMLMTVIKGPVIHLFWTKATSNIPIEGNNIDLQHSIKGAVMITIGCFSWASFMILQAITLNTYPAELSLTAWICFLGTANGTIVALVMERGNPAAWAVHWDTKFLAAFYSGIVCSGLAYYIQGIVMKVRGPVFVTAFNPLSMVIVAIMSTFILAEKMFLGRVIGAIVIVGGLYLVIWGKSKDYKSSGQLVDEEMSSSKQITYESNSGEEATDHEKTGRKDQQNYDAKNSTMV
ncbi:WAT1-related protein At2g37460-like [Impatiens glandulifera]|uniref:WAT1-related protein At2g37460-like n=1 Tax=Impatiens glandulifera TaxID=253017 RepID=UPI001FB075D4|nr:WAT1-related protein At2g37460-like [Impatiens glandulifera]